MLAVTITIAIVSQIQPASSPVERPRLVICGGGALPDTVFKSFRKLAGNEPRLVVIPTASTREVTLAGVRKLWGERGFKSVSVLHTTDREKANDVEFTRSLGEANAVWFGGGSQDRIARAYLGTRVEREIYELVKRGGVVGGTSAGAAIQSRVMIAGGRDRPEMSTGLNLLPSAIIDQHFLKRNRIPRLMHAVREKPQFTGYGIDEGTALVIDGDKATVVGRSYVLRIMQSDGRIQVEAFDSRDKFPDVTLRVDVGQTAPR